jgi:hypothetical protein
MSKNEEHLIDSKGGSSSCCGATMYEEQGICSDCGEHCESVEDEDEPRPEVCKHGKDTNEICLACAFNKEFADSPEKTDEELEFDRKALLKLDPLKKDE